MMMCLTTTGLDSFRVLTIFRNFCTSAVITGLEKFTQFIALVFCCRLMSSELSWKDV